MATLKRKVICDSICSKIGLSRRRPGNGEFDKRELLHINSAIDLLTKQDRKEIKGQGKTNEEKN